MQGESLVDVALPITPTSIGRDSSIEAVSLGIPAIPQVLRAAYVVLVVVLVVDMKSQMVAVLVDAGPNKVARKAETHSR